MSEPREVINFRISKAGRKALDDLRWEWRIPISDIMRGALRFAMANKAEFKKFLDAE